MWIDTDAARSDFILAAAAFVLTPMLAGLLSGLPIYPRGTPGLVLGALWIGVGGALSPILLAGYRGDGAAAFRLQGQQPRLPGSLLLVVPVVLVSLVRALPTQAVGYALLGRLSPFAQGDPVMSTTARQVVATVASVLGVTMLAVAGVALLTFLTTRASDGFRGTEISQTEALRTFGIGAAGLGLVMGLVNASTDPGIGWETVVINATGLVLLVLLADRMIQPGRRTTRAAILGPALVVLAAFLLGGGGGVRGGFLLGMYPGSLAAGLAVVVACLVVAERTWASIPLLVAASVYPTCMTPLIPLMDRVFLPLQGCT